MRDALKPAYSAISQQFMNRTIQELGENPSFHISRIDETRPSTGYALYGYGSEMRSGTRIWQAPSFDSKHEGEEWAKAQGIVTIYGEYEIKQSKLPKGQKLFTVEEEFEESGPATSDVVACDAKEALEKAINNSEPDARVVTIYDFTSDGMKYLCHKHLSRNKQS